MLDLHCHLLPDVDDGARSLSEAVAMARALHSVGFVAAAPSPHYGEGPGGDVAIALAHERRAALAEALVHAGVELELLANAEHHVSPELFARAAGSRVVPIGGRGRWLLVELPWGGIANPDNVLFRLQSKGYKLLLAHPERHRFLDDALIEGFVARGICLQIELGSFVAMYGDAAQERALRWSRAGWTHVVASDLHRPEQAVAWMSMALAELTRVLGEAARPRALVDNPRLIVDDASVEALLPMGG